MALKLKLKIEYKDTPLKPTMAVNLEDLLTEVDITLCNGKVKVTLPKGKLKHLQSIGKFSIFFSYLKKRPSVVVRQKLILLMWIYLQSR